YVEMNGPVQLTTTACTPSQLASEGTVNSVSIFQNASVGSLTGWENGGTFIQAGDVIILSLSLTYTVADGTGLTATATNVPVTLALQVTPLPPCLCIYVTLGSATG